MAIYLYKVLIGSLKVPKSKASLDPNYEIHYICLQLFYSWFCKHLLFPFLSVIQYLILSTTIKTNKHFSNCVSNYSSYNLFLKFSYKWFIYITHTSSSLPSNSSCTLTPSQIQDLYFSNYCCYILYTMYCIYICVYTYVCVYIVHGI